MTARAVAILLFMISEYSVHDNLLLITLKNFRWIGLMKQIISNDIHKTSFSLRNF